jgi:hypothetical protein
LNTRNLNLLVLVTFLSLFILLGTAIPGYPEAGDQDARFTKVAYQSRILSNTKDVWAFTVHNTNCSDSDQNATRFFVIFYVDKELWFNEYNGTQYKTWPCAKDTTVTRKYNIREWQTVRPTSHDVQVELYWSSNGTARLEDTTSFTIDVMIHISLQHILATGYFAAYLIACFALFSYEYVLGLEE